MKKSVRVYMSTYNGERYLKEQIDSILHQEDVSVSLLVRDDGSMDRTVSILQDYADQGKLSYRTGKNLGYAKSFLTLLTEDSDDGFDYYAFADQDDVWLKNKLIQGIRQIQAHSNRHNDMALYASALRRVDGNLQDLSYKKFSGLRLSLESEFLRHRLAGCTYVFSGGVKCALEHCEDVNPLYLSHDRLTAIVVQLFRGEFFVDSESYILFRRHGENTSIDGMSVFSKLYKNWRLYAEHPGEAEYVATYLLKKYGDTIDREMRSKLLRFRDYRHSFSKRLALACDSSFTCGAWFYDLFIKFMVLLGRY